MSIGISTLGWRFLTSQALVLVVIAKDPNLTHIRIAHKIGITERTARTIVNELLKAGYITQRRMGRKNVYQVQYQMQIRHIPGVTFSVKEFLQVFIPPHKRGAIS